MSIVLKSGNLILLEPSGPVQACNGITLVVVVVVVVVVVAVIVVVATVAVVVVAAVVVVVASAAAIALLLALQPIHCFFLSSTGWALDQGLLYLCYALPVTC